MVDRATPYQKNQIAMDQIQGRNRPGQPQAAVDIPDNTLERHVKAVPQPITARPTDEQFWTTDQHGHSKPNVNFLRDHFIHEGRLTEDQAVKILTLAKDLLSSEPNVLQVGGPVTVVGDIHGQYYDLMKIFEVGGWLTETKYLFLGDYVDRGYFGIECLLYLYTLKLWYPDSLFLLRGNHECRHLTEHFTFKRECLHKYSERVYDACTESFCALPVSALLDGKFFCVHGGISPELNTISDIDRIDRSIEPESVGLLCDLLWSDPAPNFNVPSPHSFFVPPGPLWGHNTTRGCSYYFTYEAVIKFLDRNELLGVIRGHEVQHAGYTMFRKTPKKFPSVITVFSAPNYLDVYRNRGAVLKYADKTITIRQYHAHPHPYWLPNFMDAFTWSLPFVGSKVIEMLLAVRSVCSPEELEDNSFSEDELVDQAPKDQATSPDELHGRREQIKNKIRAIGRLQVMFQSLRDGSENASEFTVPGVGMDSALNNGSRDGMDSDALGVQGNRIRYIHSFDDARRLDIANERFPPVVPAVLAPVVPPVPVVPAEDLGMGTSMVEEANENVERPVGRTGRGKKGRAGRKGTGS